MVLRLKARVADPVHPDASPARRRRGTITGQMDMRGSIGNARRRHPPSTTGVVRRHRRRRRPPAALGRPFISHTDRLSTLCSRFNLLES